MTAARKKPLFWKRVIGSPEQLENYKTVVEYINNGEYQQACLEKKSTSGIKRYTAWVEPKPKARLLFVPYRADNGQLYLLHLPSKALLQHDYDKEIFMHDDQAILRYIAQHKVAIENWIKGGEQAHAESKSKEESKSDVD